MKEETLLILKHINAKIEEDKEDYNLDENTCVAIPIGSRADYGYITHETIKDIFQLQERIDKAIEYIEEETEGRDANPIEGSWLYDLLKVKELLKGEKE